MEKLDLEKIDRKELDWLTSKIQAMTGPLRIYILKGPQRRTLPQLKYYWGVVVHIISERIGHHPEDIHEFNKINFGFRTTIEIGDQVIEKIHGLKYGKDKTKEFIDKVIQHWEEKLGEHIPAPNELSESELIEAYNRTER